MKNYKKVMNVMVEIISVALCIWLLVGLAPFFEGLFNSTWIDFNSHGIRMTLNDGSWQIMGWKYIWWLVKGPVLTSIGIYGVMVIAEVISKLVKEN